MNDDEFATHPSTDNSEEDGEVFGFLLHCLALILSLFLFALDRYGLLVESPGLDAVKWFLLGMGSIVVFPFIFAILTPSEYEQMTVVELKETLKSRELSTSGNKAELIARLHKAEGK